MVHLSNNRFSFWVAAVCILVTTIGCVRRRMTITSNPPGAQVYVDNYEIGTTPCSTDFIFYGTREVKLVRDGYETLTVKQPVPVPWYEFPGLDFVSENLVPYDIHDQRNLHYTMVPQVIVPTNQLLERAENLRRGVHTASAAQLPAGTLPELPPRTAPETLPPGGREPLLNPLPPGTQPAINQPLSGVTLPSGSSNPPPEVFRQPQQPTGSSAPGPYPPGSPSQTQQQFTSQQQIAPLQQAPQEQPGYSPQQLQQQPQSFPRGAGPGYPPQPSTGNGAGEQSLPPNQPGAAWYGQGRTPPGNPGPNIRIRPAQPLVPLH